MRNGFILGNDQTSDENHEESDDPPSDLSSDDARSESDIENDQASSQGKMDVQSSSAGKTSSHFITFDCDEPGCIKRYYRYKNLVNHHARGDHVYKLDKVRLRDKAVELFKHGTERIQKNQIDRLHNFKITQKITPTNDDDLSTSEEEQSSDRREGRQTEPNLEQGWALLEQTRVIRFSPDQVKFLNEKYDEGARNGSKWDPSAVAEVILNTFFSQLHSGYHIRRKCRRKKMTPVNSSSIYRIFSLQFK